MARVEFILALAIHTGAIQELASLHTRRKRQASARVRMLRRILQTSHPFYGLPMRYSPETLMLFAGKLRVSEAKAWAGRWKLSLPWIEAWAAYALVLWDVARSCVDPQCGFDCRRARDDAGFALGQALSLDVMLILGEPPLLISMLQGMQMTEESGVAGARPASADATDSIERYLPLHMRRVAQPMRGPHPLLETRAQFLQRAEAAWDGAIESLGKQNVSLKAPRKLQEHCEWLVRQHVLGETAASIVERLDETDPSTVHKAVKSLALLIDLPIRSLSKDLDKLN